MESYGKILLIAMPAFLLLVLLEKLYGRIKGFDTVNNLDMISSLTSGITNATKDILGLSVAIISYGWLVDHLAVAQVSAGWLTYFIAFMVLDFSGYLTHVLAHKVNFFWNNHLIHHSSEEFNLACALRQSISVFVKLFVFLLIPAALLGVPTTVIAIVAPLHLFAQFWYHTRHINKMGFLEKIIVTPSHHRVHHAINPEYLDKNFGQIFIFWDKWFGTFQEELKDVPAVYGITRPVQTWNPIKINFQHMVLLFKDAWHTKRWKDKAAVFYKPTGWRPDDVNEKFPVHKIDDVYNFEKYKTHSSTLRLVYYWVQLTVLLLMLSYFFANIAEIKRPMIFVYGGFIFLFIYALTDMMDNGPYAYVWEALKAFCGIGIITYTGNWFGADTLLSTLPAILIGYFIMSTIVCSYITFTEPVNVNAKFSRQ